MRVLELFYEYILVKYVSWYGSERGGAERGNIMNANLMNANLMNANVMALYSPYTLARLVVPFRLARGIEYILLFLLSLLSSSLLLSSPLLPTLLPHLILDLFQVLSDRVHHAIQFPLNPTQIYFYLVYSTPSPRHKFAFIE